LLTKRHWQQNRSPGEVAARSSEVMTDLKPSSGVAFFWFFIVLEAPKNKYDYLIDNVRMSKHIN
jgi:hypothetical protein